MSIFTPIKGYEDYYGINKKGEVISHFYGIILKHGMAAGYPKVTLYKLGKRSKTHHNGYNRGRIPWNTGISFVDRTRICSFCKSIFQYKRKSTRFCSMSCSAKWRIDEYPNTVIRPRNKTTGRLEATKLFKEGVLKK